MTPCTPIKPCRRQMMLAAVAATVLMLTAPHNARAEDAPPPHEMTDELMASKDGKQLPPVSEADLAKAKADVEKLRAMSDSERVDYLVSQRENAKPGDFAARKEYMRARHAYIKTLPEPERKAIKDQMKADRKAAKEKMKAKWDAMTPEQREAVKAKRKAEFDALPDDVKAKMREHRKDHKKGERHGKGFDGKDFGKKDHAETPPAPPAE